MRSGLAVAGLLIGCGPVVHETAGESSGGRSTGSTTGPSTTPPSTTSTTSGVPPVPQTSSSGDSSGSSEDGSSSTGEGPRSVCEPQPEDVHGALAAAGASDQIDATCIVQSDQAMGIGRIIRLDCAGDEYQVEVTLVGSTMFAPGDEVQFAMWTSEPWWTNTYVRIDEDGELRLAAVSAEALPGGAAFGIPPADFFAPLTHELLTDVCRPERPDDSPCDFICPEACTHNQRHAIRFGYAGEESIVYDDTAGMLGNFEVLVASAVTHVEIFCTDTPSAWFTFVIAPTR